MTATTPIHSDKALNGGGRTGRRTARKVDKATPPASTTAKTRAVSRLDQIEQMLLGKDGATIAEIIVVIGWQQHSVRGAIAGALKKRGLVVVSEKLDGIRRYRASKPA